MDRNFEGLTCLVTGGAGFIGSHLVEALAAAGAQVRVLDDLSSGSLDNLAAVADRIEMHRGSVLDADLVRALTEGCRFVFHLAAVVSVARSFDEPVPCHRVNAEGALVVAEAASRAGARLVLSSSAAVYGDNPNLPLPESQNLAPLSPYGAQKAYGEMIVGAYRAGVALRYFNVYGPRQDPSSPYSGVVSIFARRMAAGQPITVFGDGKQTRDFVYVDDVVRANMRAALSDARGAYNVCTGRPVSLLELIEILGRLLQPVEVAFAEPRIGDIRHSAGDPRSAENDLGFIARTTIGEGLAKLAAGQVA
ncbi:MAG: NAD-dependent epimerase/dehydratase family protein [Fimbriimonadaceae bacterium]